MDVKIANWILEYLLKQKSINEQIINSLISSLPFSTTDNCLKKPLILRKLESEISNGTLSENILEFLEIIAKLDQSAGKTASDVMKEAYCMVAVDCTARFLAENAAENAENGKYCEAVEKVWTNRVLKVEELDSEETRRWWKEIEEASRDSRVCERILTRNTRNEGLKSVRRYLKEGWESFGKSFLECVAANGGGGGGLDNPCREVVSCEGIQKSQADKVQEKTNNGCDPHSPNASRAVDNFPSTTRNDYNGAGPHNTEEVAHISPYTKLTDNSNNVNTVESPARPVLHVGPEVGPVHPETNSVGPTEKNPESVVDTEVGPVQPEINFVGSTEKNPESVGPVQPETNSVGSTKKNPRSVGPVQPETNSVGSTKKNPKSVGAVQPETNFVGSTKKNPNPNPKRSFMEPNGTSHTLEWDDDSDDNLSGSGRVSLPRSSKKVKVDLFQPSVDQKTPRRERKKWTPQEEETLRKAVKKFGRRWKFILGCYSDAFADRTEVDLKDKWRNLLKYPTP